MRLAVLLATLLSISGADLNFQVNTNGMADLAPLLRAHLERTKFPALAAAVVQGTNVLGAGAEGSRKAGEPVPVTLKDRFHIGSCTKSMTALLAVLLEMDGRIELTNTIEEVLREWKIPKEKSAITLAELLQNRSGIGNEPEEKLWHRAFFNPSGSPREQRRRFLTEVLQAPLAATPGSRFIYSNLGYAVAGAMLETATDTAWEELMQKRVFDPLKLVSAGFGPPSVNGDLDQPWGHTWKDGAAEPVAPSDNPSAIAPAGAVHLGILDCARYAAFHLAIARGKIESLKAYRHALYSAPKDSSYAFGWEIAEREWAGGKTITHAGSNTMFFTVIWIAPEKNFACVVATNVGDRKDYVAAQCDILVAELIEKFLR